VLSFATATTGCRQKKLAPDGASFLWFGILDPRLRGNDDVAASDFFRVDPGHHAAELCADFFDLVTAFTTASCFE